MNNLQEQYNNLINKYGEDRIIWIAAVGHSAYEQDSTFGESVTACYLPTEEELYNIIPHTDLIDIRNYTLKDYTPPYLSYIYIP